MEISGSSGTPTPNIGRAAAFSTLKNAQEAPGKAALQIIEAVADQNQATVRTSGSVGRHLNAKA